MVSDSQLTPGYIWLDAYDMEVSRKGVTLKLSGFKDAPADAIGYAVERKDAHTSALQPGGRFEILVPSTDGRGAFQDPTHVSYWNRHSFAYYSRDALAGLYPSIQCDFATHFRETSANGIVHVWAMCEAKK